MPSGCWRSRQPWRTVAQRLPTGWRGRAPAPEAGQASPATLKTGWIECGWSTAPYGLRFVWVLARWQRVLPPSPGAQIQPVPLYIPCGSILKSFGLHGTIPAPSGWALPDGLRELDLRNNPALFGPIPPAWKLPEGLQGEGGPALPACLLPYVLAVLLCNHGVAGGAGACFQINEPHSAWFVRV